MTKAFSVLLTACLALPAQAAIYKYVDAEGNVTFTDRYRPGAVKLTDDDARPKGRTTATRKQTRSASPANFPKIDRQTQSRRDDVRRGLLLEERRNEENALASVLAGFAKADNAGERARLQENRRLHEKNIEMLDKELARIK